MLARGLIWTGAFLALLSLPAGAQLSDAVQANKQGVNGQDFLYEFNGATWDRVHGNYDAGAIVRLSAQGAGTVTSSAQTNYDARGLVCVFDQSAHTGTPSTTYSIQFQDAASAAWIALLTSAAISSDTTPTTLSIYPGGPATSNAAANAPLPRVWRVSVTVAGTSPAVTATVGCNLVR
jgi:hypothetical protein